MHVQTTLQSTSHPEADVRFFISCIEDQQELRDRLPEMGLVAFIPFGAVLPRASGGRKDQKRLEGKNVEVFGEEGLKRQEGERPNQRVVEVTLASDPTRSLGGKRRLRGLGIKVSTYVTGRFIT